MNAPFLWHARASQAALVSLSDDRTEEHRHGLSFAGAAAPSDESQIPASHGHPPQQQPVTVEAAA